MRKLRIAPWVLLLAAASCGGGGGGPFGTANIELGGATPAATGVVALAGDTELVPGAQGGFHVWLKLRVHGVEKGRARFAHVGRRQSDGRLLVQSERMVEVGPTAMTTGYEHPDPIPAFMCPSPLGTRVMDEAVTFVVTLSNEAGEVIATDTATVTPRCPTGDQAAFCARICAG